MIVLKKSRRKDFCFIKNFKVNPLKTKVKLILSLKIRLVEVYLVYNSCLNVEDLSLNAHLGREIQREGTTLQVIDESDFCSSRGIFEAAFTGSSMEMMAAESELLLTEYLLNFEDENDEECSFETEGFSSDFECSEDEDVCSLSSLKETLKTNPKKTSTKQNANKPTAVKSQNKLAHEKTAEEKEKDRVRSQEYRQRKSNKIQSTEKECKQLKETNKTLNDKNIELGEKVSSLEKQIEYLEKVIANESALSAVLGAITKHSGLSFNNNPLQVNSLKRKRGDGEKDESEPQTKHSNGGVCLHLTPQRMSLEFCRECDVNAADE
jgi:hypothetical protein